MNSSLRALTALLCLGVLMQVPAHAADTAPKTGLAGSRLSAAQQEVGVIAAARTTLTYNPAIRGKRADLAAQDGRIDSAKSGRYPSVGLDARTYESQDDYGRVFVRQPLWAFGKIDAPINRAKTELRAEQFGFLQIQRQLLEQTVVAYARIEGIRRQLSVARENIAAHKRLYGQIERRQAGQLASPADVQLAYSRLTQATAQAQRLEGELMVAQAELRSLTQVEVDTSTPVDQALLSPKDRMTVEDLAMTQNADILQTQERIKVAEANVQVEKVSSNPTVYAEVEHRFLDSNNNDRTSVGVGVEASLQGMGFDTLGRVSTAAAQLDAAQQELFSARNQVMLQINSLMANLFLQGQLRRDQAASVQAVRQTNDSYLRQYESGRKSWLDVLNMQRELTEQLFLLERADNEWMIINLRLSAMTGELDQYVGIDPVFPK